MIGHPIEGKLGPTASPGEVSAWTGRVAGLLFDLERQCTHGDRDGPARWETCVAMAEAFVALDRVAVRSKLPATIVRDADGEGAFRAALQDLVRYVLDPASARPPPPPAPPPPPNKPSEKGGGSPSNRGTLQW